jgi:hypothetical protein
MRTLILRWLLGVGILAISAGAAYVVGIVAANQINNKKDIVSDHQHTIDMLAGGCSLAIGESLSPHVKATIDSAFQARYPSSAERKGTIISVMSHGCPACLENSDSLSRIVLTENLGQFSLVVVSYSVEALDTYRSILNENAVFLPDEQLQLGSEFNINTFPCNILCNKDGAVLDISFRVMSSKRFNRWIDKM